MHYLRKRPDKKRYANLLRLVPKHEWKVIKYELFVNKPAVAPYPEKVVLRRQLLIGAQCLLADYQCATDNRRKAFLGKIYRMTMETYFSYD